MSEDRDSQFYTTFKGSMAVIGLPVPPASVFGTVALATATLKTMADVIGKFGTKVTVKEMVFAFPAAGSGALVATAVGEALAVVGAMTAAYYFGACVGCMLGAAVDVFGTKALADLSDFFRDCRRGLGQPLQLFLRGLKGGAVPPRFALVKAIHFSSIA